MHNFWWTLHAFVYLHLIHSYSIICSHVVSHVIITWSNTSSIPHQYPIPLPHFILSLRTAATSTSTTHSFTIPTELPSSKIPKSKLGTFHTFKTPTGAFALCPSLTTTYSHLLHWIQPALWLNWLPTLCYWAILHNKTGVYIYYFRYVSGLKLFHDWIKPAHSWSYSGTT